MFKTIFDSGCVGTQEQATQKIEFNNNILSNSVTILVEPNCEGTIGTAWD